jgi:hypothetical protein
VSLVLPIASSLAWMTAEKGSTFDGLRLLFHWQVCLKQTDDAVLPRFMYSMIAAESVFRLRFFKMRLRIYRGYCSRNLIEYAKMMAFAGLSV